MLALYLRGVLENAGRGADGGDVKRRGCGEAKTRPQAVGSKLRQSDVPFRLMISRMLAAR